MSERPVSDAAQRREALDIGRSFIVQAPAGSGKTELLTQRYLRLLALVEQPEEIHAITFTRKAAAEMRNRIVGALQRAQADPPAQGHERQTWSLARAALARDAEQGWQLVHNPNRLRIQTFDSLSHALARQLPISSELGATPSTTERPERHYQQAARATLARLDDTGLGPDIERLLVHLDNRQAQLEGLLCAMLARRDQWLGHALASPHGDSIEQALEDAVTEHLDALAQCSAPDWLRSLCGLAQQAAAHLADRPSAVGPLAIWRDTATLPGTGWDALPAWLALSQLLLTKGGQLRKSWDARSGFPAPGEKGIPTEAKTQRIQAKQAIGQLVDELAQDPRAVELWAGLRFLPPAGLDDGQQAVLGSLLRVLLHASAELQLAFRDSAEVDFIEIQLRARQALGTPQQPTDLALALDYRLRHLLVDEFQDTSSSQYALLSTLTAGWQSGDGRSLFAVGDPMQSIYRFREADVGLYLAAREHGLNGLTLEPLQLEVNFRSTAGIVGWVNHCFPGIFPDTIDVARGAVPYAAATAFDTAPDPDAVEVHPAAAPDPAAEARHVVRLVRQALSETADGRVAILARARSHLHEIATALKAAGLGFQAVDIDPLAQQAAVRDLHALSRALLHPGDRLSWLVVLRAPFVGLDVDDLLAIAEPSPRSILARLRDPTVQATLSADGRRRVARLLGVLDGRLPTRGRQPLRPWVEGIWLQLGGLAAVGRDGEADAEAFLRLLDQSAQANGLIDFALLEAGIERLFAAPDGAADGRVQLMTMHKSKGLEFDTVILPGLGRATRGAGSELLYWLERTRADGHSQLLMAPIRAAEQDAEPISDYLRELGKDKDRLEDARLLYVAVTRARRRLHLLGQVAYSDAGRPPRPTAGSLLERLWQHVEADFARLAPVAPDTADGMQPALANLQRLAADWRPVLDTRLPGGAQLPVEEPGDGRIEFAWAGDTARHVGTLVHRQLERIADEGVEHWPPARADGLEPVLQRGLINLGVDSSELERATAKALRAIRNTLQHDTGRWILDNHAEARCEWPLTLQQDGPRHYVIDRTFVDAGGTRWIIDYKTGEHLEGDREAFLDQEQARYREQLETYGRIVRLLETRPIRLALYFPLFADWRVWDYPG
jgi:ATP-dependent exoDNAse (exonuclease V) beta subunit